MHEAAELGDAPVQLSGNRVRDEWQSAKTGLCRNPRGYCLAGESAEEVVLNILLKVDE